MASTQITIKLWRAWDPAPGWLWLTLKHSSHIPQEASVLWVTASTTVTFPSSLIFRLWPFFILLLVSLPFTKNLVAMSPIEAGFLYSILSLISTASSLCETIINTYSLLKTPFSTYLNLETSTVFEKISRAHQKCKLKQNNSEEFALSGFHLCSTIFIFISQLHWTHTSTLCFSVFLHT